MFHFLHESPLWTRLGLFVVLYRNGVSIWTGFIFLNLCVCSLKDTTGRICKNRVDPSILALVLGFLTTDGDNQFIDCGFLGETKDVFI